MIRSKKDITIGGGDNNGKKTERRKKRWVQVKESEVVRRTLEALKQVHEKLKDEERSSWMR